MKEVVQAVVIGVVIAVWIGVAIAFWRRTWPTRTTTPRVQPAPDKCKHRRWTRWKIEQILPVHTYSDVDEGRGIPDRVDVYLTRQCLRCGLPQARTVRGIDSVHYK